MPLAELLSWLCLGVCAIPLYKVARIHYFESPAQWAAFARWVEHAHPEAWARLPAWQRKYLNPLFGVHRIRREKLAVDPEFDRRLAELSQLDWRELRLVLASAAWVLLGLAFRLLQE